MAPLAAAGWSALFFLLAPMALGIVDAFSPGAARDLVNHGACVVLAASVTIFAIARVHAPEESLRDTIGLRSIAPLQALFSIVAGVGLYPALAAVDRLVLTRFPYSDDEREAIATLSRVPTTSARVAFVMVGMVVVPMAFEVLFRGALFGELERAVPARLAAVVTAFCFAASQGDPRGLPTAFVLGLAMARLRQATGTVVAAVLGAVAFEAVEGIPILRGADPLVDITVPPRWIIGGALAACVALVAIGLTRKGSADAEG